MARRQAVAGLLVMAALVLSGAAACDQDDAARTASQPAAPQPSATTSTAPPPASPTASRSPSTPPPSVPGSSAPPSGKPSTESGYGPGAGLAGSRTRTGTAAVALTFDDGPDPVNTPKILQVLREHNVKATFCMVGFRVRDHPELVRQIAADGHTLCNHSWQHLLNLAKREPGYVDWDLRHTNDMIHAAVGPDVPVRYFRAPGGNFTPELVEKARSLGMESIYWDVDPQDWNHKSDANSEAHIARVIRDVQRHVRPGSIVLSHDNGQPDTIVIYRRLLPWLLKRYTLERLAT